MKRILLFLLILGCTSVTEAQDTVRYGDPWYQFVPLPNLLRDITNYSVLEGDGPCYPNGNHRQYLGYKNNGNVIYGIAVVIDSVPGPEWYYMAALLRGIEYHNTYTGVGTLHHGVIALDSVYQEDTIKAWENPLIKKCRFEYFYEYDSIHHTYKSDSAINCYEFYFDTPIMGNLKDVLADTFFVGVGFCPPSMELVYQNPFLFRVKPGICNVVATTYLGIERGHGTGLDGIATYYPAGYPYVAFQHYWGGIFPIIERRCSVPRGLTLADDSQSVHWRSDTDAEFFQLSVCADTVEPDFGRLFTTSSTALTLPTLHPDSTYHIYLRKQCAFRQDSVWSDWSAPLTIGNGSAAIDDVSISSFQFSVFPNPTSSDITVKVSGDQESVVTLLDATGRTVIPPTPFHSSFLIPRSSLSPGVYLLRLHTATGVATKKLIVK